MVVAGILALALALPTGALFGIGYGTGVRIGYEQIYPLLFPKGTRDSPEGVTANIKAINDIYNAIGGKEASQMGIAVGLSSAMSELDQNPDFLALLKLESNLSGTTLSSSEQSRYGLDSISTSPASLSDLDAQRIEQFNIDTHADHEAGFRKLTTSQLQTAYATTNLEHRAIIGKILAERVAAGFSDVGTTSTTAQSIPTTTLNIGSDVYTSPESPQYLDWLGALNQLKIQFQTQLNLIKQNYGDDPKATLARLKIQFQNNSTYLNHLANFKKMYTEIRATAAKIRIISNDYRNENTLIREHVLRLRQEIANGLWTYPFVEI